MHQLPHAHVRSLLAWLSPLQVPISLVLEHVVPECSQLLSMHISALSLLVRRNHHGLIQANELIPGVGAVWESSHVPMMRVNYLGQVLWMDWHLKWISPSHLAVHVNHFVGLYSSRVSVLGPIECFLENGELSTLDPVLFVKL